MSDSGAAAARPVTGGRLADVGLLRPLDDRKLAGVCAGLGRVTGTDALLWRVVLATLMVLYGSGLALYLIGWLFMPSEGDSVSALGSLFSKKHSSVPKAATALLFVAAVSTFFLSLAGTGGRPLFVFGLLLLAAVLLSRRRESPAPPPPPSPTPPPKPPAEPPAAIPPMASGSIHDTNAPVAPPVPSPTPVPAPQTPAPSDATTPPRTRSVLGLVVGSLIVIAVSLTAMGRMMGAPIRMDVVFALGMLACGAGLLVATWWGRARGLILLGLVMLAGMTITPVMNALGDSDHLFADQRYRYETVDEIPESLKISLGRAQLDMSEVDFSDEAEGIEVGVLSGNMEIEIPRNVDVVVDMDINGPIHVDGDEIVPGDGRQTFAGDDGTGGGELVLTGNIDAGNLEVNR